MSSVERKLAAILAADIVAYSKFMSTNEEKTLQLVKTLVEEIISPEISTHKGQIFKTMGDGYLAEFPSIIGAIDCAISIQNLINKRDPSGNNDDILKLRIGVNLGDVIVDTGDIFGEGVIVAARLEEICEPNCVAITQRVYEEVNGKVSGKFMTLGKKKLKNIEEEIEIYSYKIENKNDEDESIHYLDNNLPSKPSIAILPFSNMSNDEEQEYFCDGITEDMITELSRFDNLFVISRNTSFTYKNKNMDLKTVAKELSVQYILEGSVRKSGQKVRITTQLIDGSDDTHLWAERYDGLLEDIFELQEQVTQQVVMSLVPEILAKQAMISSNSTRIFDEAYDKAWKASALCTEGTHRNIPEHIDRALKLSLESISKNNKCEVAYNIAGLCYLVQSLFRWGGDPNSAAERLLALSNELLSHILNSVTGYRIRGFAKVRLGDFNGAISDLQKARDLNPNDSETVFGLAFALASVGNAQKSRELSLIGKRLSPKDPFLGRFYYLSMAMCYFIERDNDNFLDWAEKAIEASPYAPIRRALMIAYAMEKKDKDLAQKHYTSLNSFAPNFIPSVLNGENILFADDEHSKRINNGLKEFLTMNV